MLKSVIKNVALSERIHSQTFRTVGLRSSEGSVLDPFLNIDLFRMSAPTFPPHPHAGFSAVTYMLPESKGSFTNRDSFGDRSRIGPGDIHWTQAGAGMMHEEVPAAPGADCIGFQIFVNLERVDKGLAPKAFHAEAESLPELRLNGSVVKVVSGTYGSQSSPLADLATPVTLLDISVEAQSELQLELDAELNWFFFVISGEGVVSGDQRFAGHQALLLSEFGDRVALHALTPVRLLACAGRPIGEPVVWGGPFCMTSVEEIQAANARFRSGGMGRLTSSF